MQRSLLPGDFQDETLAVRTVFRPMALVSGDFFGYCRLREKNEFRGYVIDVSGHGIATALYTATVSTRLNEMMQQSDPWSSGTLERLNREFLTSFQEDAFVAVIIFSLDFVHGQLTCWSGGINYLLASTQRQSGFISIPGMFLGAVENPEFNSITLPIQNGDTFYFMSDGISEGLIHQMASVNVGNFEATVGMLAQYAAGVVRDDCSALCLKVRGQNSFPLNFSYTGAATRNSVRERIHRVIDLTAGVKAPEIVMALDEALRNAGQHGRTIKIRLNQIGSRLVIRVKHDGDGFAGNALLDRFRRQGTDSMPAATGASEWGRGLSLMVAWSDRVLYNRWGTEVMLVNRVS